MSEGLEEALETIAQKRALIALAISQCEADLQGQLWKSPRPIYTYKESVRYTHYLKGQVRHLDFAIGNVEKEIAIAHANELAVALEADTRAIEEANALVLALEEKQRMAQKYDENTTASPALVWQVQKGANGFDWRNFAKDFGFSPRGEFVFDELETDVMRP